MCLAQNMPQDMGSLNPNFDRRVPSMVKQDNELMSDSINIEKMEGMIPRKIVMRVKANEELKEQSKRKGLLSFQEFSTMIRINDQTENKES